MFLLRMKRIFYIVILVAGLSACNYPVAGSPTPFSLNSPDLTLTAIYSAQGLTTETPAPPVGSTGIPSTGVTNQPGTSFPGLTPAATSAPSPAVSHPNVSMDAAYLSTPPTIDGDLAEWSRDAVPVDVVVYGKDKWSGLKDLSANVILGWNETGLFLAGHVNDQRYVQVSHGNNIYLGDSLEIMMDTDLNGDYNSRSLDADDYQLGISPGSPAPGSNPEAYLWYPGSKSGPVRNLQIAAKAAGEGYDFEVAIPWSVFSINPQPGAVYGFAFSVSDDDKPGFAVQKSMVSNDPERALLDPTTWGQLRLVKP